MNISYLDNGFKYGSSREALDFIKYKTHNNISWLNLGDVIKISKNVKKDKNLPLDGKWEIVGSLENTDKIIVIKKVSIKDIVLNVAYNILEELKNENYIIIR